MKILILSILVILAFADSTEKWDVVSSLPVSYTGLPFNLELGLGHTEYSWKAYTIPSFVHLDSVKGILTGQSQRTGAWPVTIKVINKGGQQLQKQYILNVVDSKKEQIWAQNSQNYYERKSQNNKAFRIVTTHNPKDTLAVIGKPFSYKFLTSNTVGKPVFAFQNLPKGFSGDVDSGTVTGTFGVAGIYTLGVEIADQSGETTEGFVTITVVEGSKVTAAGVSSLNKVTVSNKVDYIYDVKAVLSQQVQADTQLFEAIKVVNNFKSQLATKQVLFDKINVKITAAETEADKASAVASQANTDRENAAARLKTTNKALNNAEDKLNLALLEQAGIQANLKKAEALLVEAESKLEKAKKELQLTEKKVQETQAVLNDRKLKQAQAETRLRNAQKDYNRANEDLNDAKQKVNDAEEHLRKAEDELTQAKDDLQLATQAYKIASGQLTAAKAQFEMSYSAHQASLKVVKQSTIPSQENTITLGAAEWNLSQAIGALNVAQAAKEAADKTSALIIANGIPQKSPKINVKAQFHFCEVSHLPSFIGSVKISKVYADRALLQSGNTILFGRCTAGSQLLLSGATVTIKGYINTANDCIEVIEVQKSELKK